MSRGVDEDFRADLGAVRGEHLGLDVITVPGSRADALIAPSHDEAAVRQGGDLRLMLGKQSSGVDEDFRSDLGAVRGEHLRLDGIIASVPGRAADAIALIGPGHDETATGESGDLGKALIALDRGVDEDFRADLGAIRGEHLRLDGTAAVVPARTAHALAPTDPG